MWYQLSDAINSGAQLIECVALLPDFGHNVCCQSPDISVAGSRFKSCFMLVACSRNYNLFVPELKGTTGISQSISQGSLSYAIPLKLCFAEVSITFGSIGSWFIQGLRHASSLQTQSLTLRRYLGRGKVMGRKPPFLQMPFLKDRDSQTLCPSHSVLLAGGSWISPFQTSS